MQPIPHDRFPKRVQTVSEFAKNKGLTEEYVRQCCRQQVDGNGNYAKLPKGYLSKKEGRTWKIYYTGADLSALEKSKFDYLVALDEVLETWQRLDQELLHSDESSEEYLDLRVKLGKATSKLTKDQYAQVLNQLMTLSRLCSTLSVWKRNRLSNSLKLLIEFTLNGEIKIDWDSNDGHPAAVALVRYDQRYEALVCVWLYQIENHTYLNSLQLKEILKQKFGEAICVFCGAPLSSLRQRLYCRDLCKRDHRNWVKTARTYRTTSFLKEKIQEKLQGFYKRWC